MDRLVVLTWVALAVATLSACSGRDRTPPEVPGLELGRLTSEERNTYRKILQVELSPCGGRETLEQSLYKQSCPLSRYAAKFVAYRIEQDDTRTEISERFIARYGSAGRVDIPTDGAPSLGRETAPVTIIIFSDFQCPFCARAGELLRSRVEENEGEIRLIFLNFPIAAHQMAFPAAIAGLAAHRQQRFWQLHDLLFENRTRLSEDLILGMAEEIGLDVDQFREDMLDPALERQVRTERARGQELGIQGTPAIFINGRRFEDPIDRLDEAIAEELVRSGVNQQSPGASQPSGSPPSQEETNAHEDSQ